MSGIMKVFLLLAVVACIAKAQLYEASQSCLCQRFRNATDIKSKTKDIQFYPATYFCNRVEIVITSENGYRYCLNTELQPVKKMITRFLKSRKTSTSKPTDITISTATSTTTGTSSTNPSSTSTTTGTSSTSSTCTTIDTSSTSPSSTSTTTGTSSTSSTSGSWCLAV